MRLFRRRPKCASGGRCRIERRAMYKSSGFSGKSIPVGSRSICVKCKKVYG